MINKRLTFAEHINDKINVANKIVGMVKRSFEYLDILINRTIFKSMVKPHLKYAQEVWSRNNKKDLVSNKNVLC